MYSLDTSFFMDWHARYYPLDLFPTLERNIVSMIAAGTCGAVDLVREEIDAVGTPGLRAWALNQSGLFLRMIPEVQMEAAAIEARYPELMDPKALNESADAYVIALAKHRDWVVVSQETSVQEKHRPRQSYFIPDVCRDLGIPCVNLLGMMRREKWVF
ncbi:MAG TPA: DUF4411 family protein [Candidatus Binatia bacterium]|jgi:hypothetical protein|nr:DUF4411 family protein [Candidatus Binatia bacterium]